MNEFHDNRIPETNEDGYFGNEESMKSSVRESRKFYRWLVRRKLEARLRAILITAVLFLLACLPCAWWWQATRAEHLWSFNIPHCFTSLAGRYYGIPNDQWIKIIDADNVSGVQYSIDIHKSQIHPWGTLWRTTTFMRKVNGEWVFAGQIASPLGSPVSFYP